MADLEGIEFADAAHAFENGLERVSELHWPAPQQLTEMQRAAAYEVRNHLDVTGITIDGVSRSAKGYLYVTFSTTREDMPNTWLVIDKRGRVGEALVEPVVWHRTFREMVEDTRSNTGITDWRVR